MALHGHDTHYVVFEQCSFTEFVEREAKKECVGGGGGDGRSKSGDRQAKERARVQWKNARGSSVDNRTAFF